MANYSTCVAEFKLVKSGSIVYPPKKVVEMILKTSADEGWQNDDGSFTLAGRWTYDHNLTYDEMLDICHWLREYNYAGMIVDFIEYEEGEGFCSIGKATYSLSDIGETDITVSTSSWFIDDFCEKFLDIDYPDDEDFEDEDGDLDYDALQEAKDHMYEVMFDHLEIEMLKKGYNAFDEVKTHNYAI